MTFKRKANMTQQMILFSL